ncbi:protein-tyrosine-phosphatase [Desulfosalsimonas propionicica]|uniref:protein-tyrosine-phosphatase n=1 Tax=Desulfosalsimonas propionicica TaxID=332175 RepID=A0A7W0CC26_9BACT|nr:hypothetical protein [Desulfosalsimonas propionicica]MBA2883012.1 protein-tyrosine-phosphatase [Desulfosalsimonas propionicica]
MKLVVTIDTEEDNQGRYSAVDNPVKNIERLPALQKLFDKYGIRPTYLISYPVASSSKSVAALNEILAGGSCEIGMHCHPWNTPPFHPNEPVAKRDTMLCNLDENLVHAKLGFHHETIQKNFGITPVSFRAGRFGFGPAVAKSLLHLNYRVDSSVTPFVSWEKHYGPDFTNFFPDIFRFSAHGLAYKEEKGPLLEVPVTIGFLQNDFAAANQRHKALEKPFAGRLHILGILGSLGLLNKLWLSPEVASAKEMIRLARKMEEKQYPLINLTFHSTSLRPGSGQFVKNSHDEFLFFEKLSTFLNHVYDAGWDSLTLAELDGNMDLYTEKPESLQNLSNYSRPAAIHARTEYAAPGSEGCGFDGGLHQQIKSLFPRSLKRKSKTGFQNVLQSAGYRWSRKRNAMKKADHIVFVCKGNICRSVFAEHALKNMLPRTGIKVESCGLDVDRQTPSPQEAVEAAGKFGVDLRGQLSKRLENCNLQNADLIVAMEYDQIGRLTGLYPEYRNKTVLLREFAPFPVNVVCNINDPYGLEPKEFARCFGLINKSLRGLISRTKLKQ